MALSRKDREELRDVINDRIGEKVSSIRSNNKSAIELIKANAHDQVIDEAGLADLLSNLGALQEQYKSIGLEIGTIQDTIMEQLKAAGYTYRLYRDDITSAVNRLADTKFDALFAESPVGQEIAALYKAEKKLKQDLLFVQLPAEIQAIFTQLETLLGDS